MNNDKLNCMRMTTESRIAQLTEQLEKEVQILKDFVQNADPDTIARNISSYTYPITVAKTHLDAAQHEMLMLDFLSKND